VAATVRLTGRDARLALVGVGAFGTELTRALATGWPKATPVSVGDVEIALADGVEAAVVALWRPSPTLADDLDDLFFRYGRPWLPVIVEHPHLVVGPWIAPPGGPCLRCYEQRRRQHEPAKSLMSALHRAYDADPALGPDGHLPHHVRTASGLVDAVLRRALTGDPALPGRVTVRHLVTGALATHHTVGVHGCPRCGAASASHSSGPRSGGLAAVVSRFAAGGRPRAR
jgi:bacteriocin biosynthesis cyclodehydratase domain-containing protein